MTRPGHRTLASRATATIAIAWRTAAIATSQIESGWASRPATRPGSASSASAAAPGGEQQDEPCGEARLGGGGAGVAADPLGRLERGGLVPEQAGEVAARVALEQDAGDDRVPGRVGRTAAEGFERVGGRIAERERARRRAQLVARRPRDPARRHGDRAADRVAGADRVGQRARRPGRALPDGPRVPPAARADGGDHQRGPGHRRERTERDPADEPAAGGQRAGREQRQPAPLRPGRRPALVAGPHERLDRPLEDRDRPRALDRRERLPRAEQRATNAGAERERDGPRHRSPAAARAARDVSSAAAQAGGEPVGEGGSPAAAAASPGVDLPRGRASCDADDLGDGDDAAGAVGRPRLADDEVEGVGDLLAQRRVREPEAGHQRERLDAPERLGGRAGVDRAERAVVAGRQRGQHVERLRAADLADHDPVRPHPQRVAHEPADRDLAAALEVRRPRLEPDHVRLAQPQLGGVLDRDHALARADEPGQDVERRRLARAGAAADEHARPGAHRAGEEVEQRRRERAVGDQLLGGEAAAAEAADRQHGTVERQRRDHDVHARAVREPRVAQRLGLVDPAAERRQDPLDRVAQVALVGEPHRRALEAAAALDPDRRGPAHHHLLDRGIAEQRLERAEAERALGDPARELGARRFVEHRGLAVDERADPPRQVLAAVGVRQQAVAQLGGQLVEFVHRSASYSRTVRSSATAAPPARRRSPGGRASRRISVANAPAAAR